jgi:hypothetical protein
MNKIIFLSLMLLLIIPTANVYAGGPRHDYDDRYSHIPRAPECWTDGYDAGFANKYDEDRDGECENKGDQYNVGFGYGCIDSGQTKDECEDIKNDPTDLESHKQLQE